MCGCWQRIKLARSIQSCVASWECVWYWPFYCPRVCLAGTRGEHSGSQHPRTRGNGGNNSVFHCVQGTTAAPAATTMTNQGTMVTNQGTMVAAQPGAPIATPMGNTTYYYYRSGLFGRRYRVAAPATTYVATATPVYTAPVQTYSTPVRRRWPFGLFRRRFNQPMSPYTTTYTTPGYYTTTPGYYTTAGNYAPTVYTNTVPTPVRLPRRDGSHCHGSRLCSDDLERSKQYNGASGYGTNERGVHTDHSQSD